MWWIPLIIVLVILVILIIIGVVTASRHDKGDYGDGGGTQIGGDNHVPFFTPANERAGIRGEHFVNYHLRPLLREDEYLLANVLLPLKNNKKTEIDAIMISRKGIFCIETKNWVGHIRGSDEDEYWIQEYDDPYMPNRQHKNPVIQNDAHCEILQRILNNRFKVYGAVIFAELEDGLRIHSECTFSIVGFKRYFRELSEDDLGPEEIKQIYQKLVKFVASPDELREHREEVRKRYN